MAGLFAASFWSFVVSIVAWLGDTHACALLHNLPYGLPYPQLHALGWHGGTFAGTW